MYWLLFFWLSFAGSGLSVPLDAPAPQRGTNPPPSDCPPPETVCFDDGTCVLITPSCVAPDFPTR